jgi:GMP synthase (glutamine-hydrolysing)
VRPFLLLASRAEDAAAEGEYEAFLKFTGLPPEQLHRIRMEAGPLPDLDLDDYAGILLGGSPFNSSDPPEAKSAVQRRVEQELRFLLDQVVERDLPFFGACYGVGTLGAHQGGIIDRTYAEPLSAVSIELTAEGVVDPLLAGMPESFEAFVGHKEACRVLPPSAVRLAGSAACPVQMFRVKSNVYATQFHPELDVPGFCARARVYQHYGYFPPDELEELIARLSLGVVTEPGRLLKNFVARYGKDPVLPTPGRPGAGPGREPYRVEPGG